MEIAMNLVEDDYRKIMLELGFNLLILPKTLRLENFYNDGQISEYMPEEYVTRLSCSNIVTIRHLLPILEQKIRWPEQGNRTIILTGTRGEVPFLDSAPMKPMLVAVPEGKVVLGYELWKSLGLKEGQTISILGSDFQVRTCHSQRGTRDDITAWIDLRQAQDIFERQGEINAIFALKCHCVNNDISLVRADISRILPETQVIEISNRVATRAKARDRAKATADSALASESNYRARLRQEHETFAVWLIPVVILGSTTLIGMLAFTNVRERKHEIGILRALGFRSKQILFVFLAKAFLIGFWGALLGYCVGFVFGIVSSELPWETPMAVNLFKPVLFLLILVTSPLLSSFASWVPALIAAHQDPATVLREG
jgi:ABC-type lipoprotein release transport system permease subunit